MKHLIFFFIYCTFDLAVTAQNIVKTEIDKTIDSIFQPSHLPNFPGVAVTVLQNGKVITKKNFGLANLEHAIPFTHKSPVQLVYSMGREFISAGLAVMEAEGLLRFDDKVRSYFPSLPEWSKDVTIQDLLNHNSGFDDEWSLLLLMHADMRNRVDKEQLLTLLYNQTKPQVEPGKGYMYCNTDYALLRMIMDIVSKQHLVNYLKHNLFDRLGMSSTLLNDDIETVIPGFAESYYGNNPFRKGRFYKTSPGGNYRTVTTAEDLEKWALAIMDSSSFLAKAFKRLYKDAKPIPVISPEQHFLFGHEWRRRERTQYMYHGGVDEGFYLFRIPSRNIAIITLGNSGNSIAALMQLSESMLPAKPIPTIVKPGFPTNPVSLSKSELSKFVGRYFDENGIGYNSHVPRISYYDIKAEGDSIQFYYRPDASFPLTPFGNGLFKDMEDETPITFTRAHPDSAMQLKIWPPQGNTMVYRRQEKNVEVSQTYLQQFTGKFYSSHLDYYFRIVLNKDGQLIIKRPTLSDTKMDPNGENSFLVQLDTGGYFVYTTLNFSRNNKGQFDGFNLRYSRLMDHRFEKVE